MKVEHRVLAHATASCAGGALILFAGVAQADVVISSAATKNMFCSGGICAPTAANAVLNAGDLETQLSMGSVTVTTTGTAIQANDIKVSAGCAWSNSKLSLDAYKSITVNGAISVTGNGSLSLQTNDGGSGGALSFGAKGNVTFASLSSGLSIDGISFTLVDSVATLASAVSANSNGNLALANDYDASKDGTYSQSPVSQIFGGKFEALGNAISNLSISDSNDSNYDGLFYELSPGSSVADLYVANVNIDSPNVIAAGAIAGDNQGTIANSAASGAIDGGRFATGGIAGYNFGSTTNSSSTASVEGADAGGLVGMNGGTIADSRATGSVEAVSGPNSPIGGGLAGDNQGTVETSFATGPVNCGVDGGSLGGLIGEMDSGTLKNAYSLGAASGAKGGVGGAVGLTFVPLGTSYSTGAPTGTGSSIGGYVGYDFGSGGNRHAYWDTTSSGITDPSKGAGNIANDPGIKALTTTQLQAKLPKGFSSKIWALDAKVNGGLPYLRKNPPVK